MSMGKSDRTTQQRVIELFREELKYRLLGNWTDRSGNSNIEESLLAPWLKQCG
jgi:type I restriction enzyme R subunit